MALYIHTIMILVYPILLFHVTDLLEVAGHHLPSGAEGGGVVGSPPEPDLLLLVHGPHVAVVAHGDLKRRAEILVDDIPFSA